MLISNFPPFFFGLIVCGALPTLNFDSGSFRLSFTFPSSFENSFFAFFTRNPANFSIAFFTGA